jgi:GAF domain-containing protein
MTALRPDVVADLREENARLLAELRDARDRQAGSAEILRAIADASGDAERSLQQIAETTARLFDASSVTLNIASGDEWARMIRVGPSSQRVGSEVSGAELRIGGRNLPGTVFRENRQIHIPDLDNLDPAFADWLTLPHARAAGARAMAGTPLRREGKAVGALVVHRDRPVPFTDEELALLQSFADQAVIAIQNARLFNETREALERQTATADILKIIASSPSDVQPVFEAIAESANRLIGGYSTSVFSFVDDVAHLAAFTPTNPAADAALKASFPRPLSTQPWAEQIRDGEIVHVPDIETDPAVPANLREVWRMRGFRGLLVVPLRRDRASIGMIAVTRAEPGSFAAHHVQLLHTFADQAVIAIENTRLFNETREALERQTATADILKVIASSPSDVQPVFEAIASSANRLLGGFSTAVFRFVDDAAHLAAFTPTNPAADELLKTSFPLPFANYAPLQLVQNGETVQFADTETAPDFQAKIARARGFRSILLTPLMSNGAAIGMISVTRVETGSFADHHVQLLQTFAAQAVIAIENVRLFNETREALERQTATADILKVIASSPSDVQPVFAAIAASANRLIGGFSTAVFRFVDGVSHLAAFTPTHPAADEILRTSFPRPLAEFQPFELAYKGEPVQIADTETYFDARIKDIARARGFRSMLFSPLMSNGAPIGLISVTRLEPGTFAAHHVQLLQTFADQAVIAIENVRLFEEVQAKTSDLSEALQQQTATADVLKVISRSAFDLDTVMNTLARSAAELCTADLSGLFLRDGEFLALRGISDAEVRVTDFLRQTKVAIDDQSYMGRSMLSGTIANVPDFDRDTTSKVRTFQQALGFKAMLIVPLMREGRGVGVFALCRNRVGAFSQRQIELVQTFADQAVIAIENVRLFDEVQARTRELTESLEYQTATGEVLNVISRSPNNLQPVMDTIVHTTRRLCQSEYALMLHRDDARVYRIAAHSNASQELMDWMQDNPVLAGDGSAIGITAAEKQTVHLPDALADPRFTDVRRQRQSKGRTMLGVPLLRGQEVIGVVLLVRTEVKPFSNKQIDLVTNFADQAVIAIENVRLFDEVQARTKELAASLDDLRTAQGRLVQTEKLASLGQLTAGIAHEIKNPLNFVNNFSALSAELTDELNDVLKPAALNKKMREEVDELTRMLKGNLEKVVQHGKRADSIVKNMLLHSREGSGERRPTDINALLDEGLNLAYHGARAEKPQFNVTLQRDFDENAGTVELFPQEITRAFLNLISNGFYAATKRKAEIGSRFDPILRATTRNLGDSVEIRIRDNGPGIPAEVKEKMFNPFFTTKPAGEGTGLGLSMSHDIIVKQHGGTIDVETAPGQFTEFTIVLPRTSNIANKTRGQT